MPYGVLILSFNKQEFHTNFNSKMCYLEDVYHMKCSHWSDKPRTYHICAAGANQSQCFNKKKCGAVQDDSFCKRCLLRAKEVEGKENKGMWISLSSDSKTNRVVVKRLINHN